jgi:serine/threonine protein kinase/tetratricopeptide (TPR) repeat protein
MAQLTQERWRRVAAILDEVLELEAAPRSAYLDRACVGDPELRREVDALLAADSASGEFLAGSVESYLPVLVSGSVLDETLTGGLPEHERIGPYRVLRELAHGGMGAVYLAERADGQFEQRVAVKLIRRGMDSEEVHRRFRAERQILARLNHPNIARLLDGGITADGQPWFAMEYVDGEPLVTWCQARQTSLAGRIELFRDVCDAVRYAHQSLVVHRDLKPSNILVTQQGQTKLLDFGIAKLLEDGGTGLVDGGGSAPATRTELRVMTPEYAAPEQVRGEPVTTATDVYALGAVLYELLTEQRAHQFERQTPAEVERVICDTEPTRPSQVVSNPRRRELAGDLDTIVLKALEKDPVRRYHSAESLLDDLRRYLERLPISARPSSLGYRAHKFIRRHRAGVIASLTLVLMLVGGVAATAYQARAKALEAAKAREVKDFVVGLFALSDPAESRGRDITARELLERGVRRVDSALGRQPAVQEELLGVLGKIHRELGLYAQADSLLGRAVDVARRAYGPHHPEYAARLTDRGTVLKAMGQLAPAESLLREALAIRRRALGPDHADVAATMGELAATLQDHGEFPVAESLYRAVLALDTRRLGREHLEVATDLDNLGTLLSARDNLMAADSAHRASLAIRRKLLDPDHPLVLNTLSNLAATLNDMGRYAEAESLFRIVLEGHRKHHPQGHPDVADAITGLAIVYEETGRWVEAESLHAQALEMRRRVLGVEHHLTMASLNNLAVVRYRMGNLSGAEEAFREAARLWEHELGPTHQYTLRATNNLGAVLSEEGKLPEAERLLRKALEEQRRALGDSGIDAAVTRRNLGVLLRRSGHLEEAEEVLRMALATYRRELPDSHPRTAEALTALGQVLTDRGRPAEADSLLREALAIREVQLDSTDLRIPETREALGLAAAAQGQRARAESLITEACRAFATSRWAGNRVRECRSHLASLRRH